MDRRCEYVPVDAYRYGMESLKDVNLEAKLYFRESYEWGGNAGNNGTKKNHTVQCAAHGGVCAIAAKVMEIETKPGMGKAASGAAVPIILCSTGSSPPRNTSSIVTWTSRRAHGLPVGARAVLWHAPAGHARDYQRGSDVLRRPHELAVKGDNGPNESSIANVTYDVSKDDLNHILGCPGFCSVDRYKTGCERMGGEWDDSSGLGSAKCKNIPNDNPTGSWEQVNTFLMPIPGTSTVKSMEGGLLQRHGRNCQRVEQGRGRDWHQHSWSIQHVHSEERVRQVCEHMDQQLGRRRQHQGSACKVSSGRRAPLGGR